MSLHVLVVMAPFNLAGLAGLERRSILPTKPQSADGLILSAWAQGYMAGSIIIMACITIANMRREVLLHKLILLEVRTSLLRYLQTWGRNNGVFAFPSSYYSDNLQQLLLGFWHGTYIFMNPPVYAWYLSVTALLLNISWSLHNVIAWMKNKPFFSKRISWIYIGTVILAQPYWIVEIYADFAYFGGVNNIFVYTRPLEAIFR